MGVPGLRVAVVLSLVAAALAVIGLFTGQATIGGAPAWLKPLKFAVSIVSYCATVAVMLAYVEGRPRLVATLAWVTGLSLTGELGLIDLQAMRGTTSHFNTTTSFNATVFAAMGGLVAVVLLAALVTAVLLIGQKTLPAPLRTGVRGGLIVNLLGMLQGITMLIHRGHTVGAPDGGPGWWLLGWSTGHGDLRIGHFLGLHALQALPVAALLVPVFFVDLTPRLASRLVTVTTVFYAGLVVLVTWQAERGEQLQRPSALVLAAGATWVVAFVSIAQRTTRTSRFRLRFGR